MTDSTAPRKVARPTRDDFARAREVVAKHLPPTPLLEMSNLDGVWLKLETLQPTGSFKVRGALAAMASVAPGQRVLAASAGNHALGIAWAASRTGTPATVVLAHSASPAKQEKLATFPIELVKYGATYDEAEAYAVGLARDLDDDTVFISPYNDPQVIAGQATVLDEIVAQLPTETPFTVVVPIGGGGLLAGVALRAEELREQGASVAVVGVEVSASPAVSSAITAGQTTTIDVGETIADGLSGNLEPGSVTVELISGRVVAIVQVDEAEIEAALRTLAWDVGVLAEGSGAASLAAILAGKVPNGDAGPVVAIISGRNITHPVILGILAQ